PYGGTPAPVPGTIQAENFDEGGSGVAYVDSSPTNQGGKYRTNDAVDIESTTDAGGGYDVGYVTAGEWMKYTVNVTTAGSYDIEFRVASSGGGRTFHLEINGTNVTGSLAVPNTGGWQTWATIKKTGVTLNAGSQVWTFVADSGGSGSYGNLNYIRVAAPSGGGGGPEPFGGTPTALPSMKLEFENFDEGGANVAYADMSSGNSGGKYRPTEDVDIESTPAGGYDVGWVSAGEWLKYTVAVATAGTYALDIRVGSAGTGGTFHIEVNGVDKTGPISVPNTGGWQTWQTIRVSGVTLAAGTQVWRVVMDTGSPTGGAVGNFNWLQATLQ
ncbi:MAG TPA: carbohydrate-binding protein, partial [Vicinamibacterales bacterium]|nr:carbohydrate-binding protein [Vicinamibacterales bacterium]